MKHLTNQLLLGSCLLISLLNSSPLLAQSSPFPTVDIKSPNAAALEKYGEIPVSYHTGVPQITVPLYEVVEGLLTLPIYLSYHASGLKVLEPSSFIGANWTLMGAGAITRTVKGLPDDNEAFGTGVFAQWFGHYSDRGYSTYVRNSDNLGISNPDGSPKYVSFQGVAQNWADGEPDRYYINVPGFSGEFYFNDDQQAIFEPVSDVQVTPFHSKARGFYQWEVTLPDGTRYTFGKEEGEEATRGEKSYPFYENQTGNPSFHAATTSWMLTKIASADGEDVIRFKYEEEKYGFHTFSSSGIAINSASFPTRVKNSVAGWRLKEITFSQGKVRFLPGSSPREDLSDFEVAAQGTIDDDPNTEAYPLGTIEVLDSDGSCQRRFALRTSYFYDTDSQEPSYQSYSYPVNTDRKRLKLDQVQEVGCQGTAKPPYVFSYYDEEKVPRRLSYSQDHWGYYNGVNNNTLVPPNTPISGSTTRSSCYPEMQAGTLQQINYPTGGSTTFDYEANQVWRQFYEQATTFKASHRTAGISTITKTVTLAAGDYRVGISSSSGSSNPQSSYLSLRKSSDATERASYSPTGSQENFYNVTLSGGSYVLSAQAPDNVTSASMSLYLLSNEERSGNFDVGGLRVHKITNQAGNGQPDMVQTFNYQRGFSTRSSGVLFGRPVYRSLIRNDYNSEVSARRTGRVGSPRDIPIVNTDELDTSGPRPECFDVWRLEQSSIAVSAQSIFPTEETQGYHIGYQQVKVLREDGSYIGYEYDVTSTNDDPYAPIAVTTVEDYDCTADIPNYPSAPLSYVPERGQLLREVHVDTNDQTKQEVSYDYTYEPDQEVVPGFIATSLASTPFVTFYKLQSAKLTAREVTTRTYDQNNPGRSVATTTYYRYDDPNHTQLTEQHAEVNDGTLSTNYRYVPDYTTGCEVSQACQSTYQSETQSCEAEFEAKTSQTGCEFWTGCWYYAYRDYEVCVSETRSAYSQCNINAREEAQACLQQEYTQASGEYQALLSLQASNQVGLPLEVSQWKDNQFLSATLTEFQDQGSAWSNNQFMVYPHRSFQVEAEQPLPAARFSPSTLSGKSLTKDDDYQPKVDYLYEQGRPVQIIVEDGLPTAYLYGYDYTLPVAKVVGATYAAVKAKVNPTAIQNQDGNALRAALAPLRTLANAQVTIYTYDPLVGVTSETDPSGRIMTYEYDDLGRLKWIKDQEGHLVQRNEYEYQ